ncbi:MAG: thiamine-phosphate kinase [Chloroflexota bacterium]|nr:thiamine-phosphate kinase [Chloroflexota bacterium]
MVGRESRVRDIGEFALIDRLTTQLPPATRLSAEMRLGIGDDAAIWNPAPGRSIVITTDALVEHMHFRLDWTDWASLGHKMLAVNISDIAAMGARPRIATIVLGLTGDELVSDVESLYVGMGTLAALHAVVIAGGDVVRVPNDVTLSVTLLGDVPPGQAMARAGARPGDLVVVSGTLGAGAAGMALLERGTDPGTTGPLLIAAHLRPNPRVALGLILHEHGVTAAMDLSDGLLGDLPKILDASGTSAEIDIDRIPVLPAVQALFPDEFEQLALRGGEDYELLLTVPPDRFDDLRDEAAEFGATLTSIGRVTATQDEPTLTLLRHGAPVESNPGAFDHFR